MIAFCLYKPMPPAARQAPSIRIRCRDFTFVAFHFNDETQARNVYDSIKALTCGLGSFGKLYAFSFEPPPAEKTVDGWQMYDARKEFKRMGISPKEPDRGWRISDINHDYTVRRASPTQTCLSWLTCYSTRPLTPKSWSYLRLFRTTCSSTEESIALDSVFLP